MTQGKAYVIEYLYTVNRLAQILNRQHFISDRTIWSEIDVRILSGGRTHLIKLNLLKGSLTGSCLLTLRCICGETLNKFL